MRGRRHRSLTLMREKLTLLDKNRAQDVRYDTHVHFTSHSLTPKHFLPVYL